MKTLQLLLYCMIWIITSGNTEAHRLKNVAKSIDSTACPNLDCFPVMWNMSLSNFKSLIYTKKTYGTYFAKGRYYLRYDGRRIVRKGRMIRSYNVVYSSSDKPVYYFNGNIRTCDYYTMNDGLVVIAEEERYGCCTVYMFTEAANKRHLQVRRYRLNLGYDSVQYIGDDSRNIYFVKKTMQSYSNEPKVVSLQISSGSFATIDPHKDRRLSEACVLLYRGSAALLYKSIVYYNDMYLVLKGDTTANYYLVMNGAGIVRIGTDYLDLVYHKPTYCYRTYLLVQETRDQNVVLHLYNSGAKMYELDINAIKGMKFHYNLSYRYMQYKIVNDLLLVMYWDENLDNVNRAKQCTGVFELKTGNKIGDLSVIYR